MAKTSVRTPIFIDTNVLVSSTIATAPFHAKALTLVQGYLRKKTQLWISRQVLREYVTVLTRPQVFANPIPINTVIAQVNFLQKRFQIADDTAQVTEKLMLLIQKIPIGGKQVHDANIVATMQTYDIKQLLTNNVADFNRFAQFITIIPL